jgi:hypothetical protein
MESAPRGGADRVSAAGCSGFGYGVAVLDTGVEDGHPCSPPPGGLARARASRPAPEACRRAGATSTGPTPPIADLAPVGTARRRSAVATTSRTSPASLPAGRRPSTASADTPAWPHHGAQPPRSRELLPPAAPPLRKRLPQRRDQGPEYVHGRQREGPNVAAADLSLGGGPCPSACDRVSPTLTLWRPSPRARERGQVVGEDAQGEFVPPRAAATGGQGRAEAALVPADRALRVSATRLAACRTAGARSGESRLGLTPGTAPPMGCETVGTTTGVSFGRAR